MADQWPSRVAARNAVAALDAVFDFEEGTDG